MFEKVPFPDYWGFTQKFPFLWFFLIPSKLTHILKAWVWNRRLSYKQNLLKTNILPGPLIMSQSNSSTLGEMRCRAKSIPYGSLLVHLSRNGGGSPLVAAPVTGDELVAHPSELQSHQPSQFLEESKPIHQTWYRTSTGI